MEDVPSNRVIWQCKGGVEMKNLLENLDRSELRSLIGAVPHLPRARMMRADDQPDFWVLTSLNWPDDLVPADVADAAILLHRESEGVLLSGPALTSSGRWVTFVNVKALKYTGRTAYLRSHIALARKIRSTKARAIIVGVDLLLTDLVQAQVEGLRLGWYGYPNASHPEAPEILVPCLEGRSSTMITTAELATQATCFARLWTEEAPNRLTPTVFANMAARLGGTVGLSVEVLESEQIQAAGMGGVLSVGQGSANVPAVVRLQHMPELEPEFGIVGKGITFDSGGISLKPSDNLRKLKGDKAGASAVLAASLAAAQAGVKTPFVAVIPLAENMPSDRAYRPGDVIKMLDGTTVEIVSTDAEGRLLLADGMTMAMRHGCKHILTIATLTKASIIALGNFRAALYSTDDALADRVVHAANAASEFVWRMPLDNDYADSLKSSVSDIMNCADSGNGGSIVAAKFLQHFSEDRSWAHIDMSPIFYLDNEMPWGDKGYTGAGARLVLALLTGDSNAT
jgi:leucyl aminopeptidase